MDTGLITIMGLMGWILWADKHGDEIFTPPEPEKVEVPVRGYGVACKSCGEDGLHWVKACDQWCLFRLNDQHKCPVKPWHESRYLEIARDEWREHSWPKSFSREQIAEESAKVRELERERRKTLQSQPIAEDDDELDDYDLDDELDDDDLVDEFEEWGDAGNWDH